MPLDSTELQPPGCAASRALAVLLAAEDALPASCHAQFLFDRPSALVVLVDSGHAWLSWTVRLDEGQEIDVHYGDFLMTAQLMVAGFPVMIVKGDRLPELAVAA
jgi:hypothetical protein